MLMQRDCFEVSWPRLDGGRETAKVYPWRPPAPDRKINVEPSVRWSVQTVQLALAQAMITLKRLPARGCFPAQHKSTMPDYVHDFFDAYGWEPADVNSEEATAEQIAEMDERLSWLCWLPSGRDRVIVSARAAGQDWYVIARQAGVGVDYAQQVERKALRAIVMRLNGHG